MELSEHRLDRHKRIILLKLKGGGHVSGEDLGRELGVSRSAIWKHVRELKELGYHIESAPRRGYFLIESPDSLIADEVEAELNTVVVGCEIHSFKIVTSTNDVARRLAEDGAPDGAVVVAEEQTHGKGRMGRKWESPPSGLYMSVILRPRIRPSEASRITLLAGVAVASALESLGVEPRIKWPNDIHVGGRKIAGILTELSAEVDRINYVVLGIGINIRDCPEGATSVLAEVGAFPRARVAGLVLSHLDRLYRGDWADSLDMWKKMSDTLGQWVRVSTLTGVLEGRAIDIDPDGVLVLDIDGRHERVFAGDCFHLR